MEMDRLSELRTWTWTSENKQDTEPESSSDNKQIFARGFSLSTRMHVRKLPKAGERITPKDKGNSARQHTGPVIVSVPSSKTRKLRKSYGTGRGQQQTPSIVRNKQP